MFEILKSAEEESRRQMLKLIASLYDPKGYASAFGLVAKLLLQEACRAGLGWDDPLPWRRWKEDLNLLTELQIPRLIGPETDGTDYNARLNIFSDASELAYGVTVYMCIKNSMGDVVKSTLLLAKARVAPLKMQSIPRLELCAVLLAATLDQAAQEMTSLDLQQSRFWIDSQIVLRLINGEP